LREKYHLEDKKIVLGVANVWNARKGLPDLLTLADRLGSDYQVVLIGLTEKQLPGIPSGCAWTFAHGKPNRAGTVVLCRRCVCESYLRGNLRPDYGRGTACGTPVVVYETDGCPETVAPGNGRLVPQGDMQALENAVRDVADSNWRADPKKMARFDKDTVYQGYVELYENVLSTLKKGV
jgi:putative colanic acid biosynthesis glycosyltransferase